MSIPDLNLLVTLNVLLDEGNVARAAKRLHLSPSAMSRALARLRATTGDPLLVRAGRGLVPTPRAMALRDSVSQLVQDAESVLRPALSLDLSQLERTFTIRTREGFVENFGPDLVARINAEAPGVRLRFLQKLAKDSGLLRAGAVDLETGVVGEEVSPEIRTRALFKDRFVGVVRPDHPLCQGEVTTERYVQYRHVYVSLGGADKGAIDRALDQLGHTRDIVTIVSGFTAALALARSSNLIASVPERHTGNLRAGMHTFALPVETPDITVSMLWHPRMDADLAHRWLREVVRDVCSASTPKS